MSFDTIRDIAIVVLAAWAIAALAGYSLSRFVETRGEKALKGIESKAPAQGGKKSPADTIIDSINPYREAHCVVVKVPRGEVFEPMGPSCIEWLSVLNVEAGETRYLKMGPSAYRYAAVVGWDELMQLVASGSLDRDAEFVLVMATINALDRQTMGTPEDESVKPREGKKGGSYHRLDMKNSDFEKYAKEYDKKSEESIVKDSDVDKLIGDVGNDIKGGHGDS